MPKLKLKVTNDTATLHLHTGGKAKKENSQEQTVAIGIPLLPSYPAKALAAYAKELSEALDLPLVATRIVTTTATTEEPYNV